eukprot:CAMPEP_0172574598 /NCGR_PEP_ID=MMETSP1067-20121228/136787_1 /TAXON_ID=265564 ORGANISM="Thalassiosira punctigera, Strain Tpunct2005C2" /NCGR_SAMPLE_ID=MMETSP1067 /ASSEMBLY_ACC=CAM_ASM_000444 /LENGTH=199 /DNA_ID=CAMNT_0013367231 /DNA_START=298 /DNA_END=897 /DNA_ORIENTATION=+
MALGNGDTIRSLVILLILTAVHCCSGFCLRPGPRTLVLSNGIIGPRVHHQLPRQHQRSNNSNDDDDGVEKTDGGDDRDLYTWEELQADPELRKVELDSSMNRKNNMLLPQRISMAVTTLGWMFVIGGVILEQSGYAWVKSPTGGLGIGTLDERDFQMEIMRERRKDEGEKNPTLSVSETEIANIHVLNWIEQQQNSRTV